MFRLANVLEKTWIKKPTSIFANQKSMLANFKKKILTRHIEKTTK